MEEPPTEAPPPEPPITTSGAPHAILPITEELNFTALEDSVFNTVLKVAGHPHTLQPTDKQWKSLCPLFGWLDEEVIKKTVNHTT